MVLNDIFAVKLWTYCIDQLGVNVLHYKCSAVSGVNDYDATSVAAALSASVPAAYKALMSQDAEFVAVVASAFAPFPGPESVDRSGAGLGTQISSVMSKQTAGVVTKQTIGIGR